MEKDSLLSKIPTGQLLLGLLSTLRDHYIFVFLLTYAILHPGYGSIMAAIVGLFFNHFLLNILHQVRGLVTIHLIREGKIKPFLAAGEAWTMEKVSMLRFTTPETYEEIQKTALFQLQSRSLNDIVHIYRISPSNAAPISDDPKVPLLANVVCYARPFEESYVFIDTNPENMRAFGRFKVLHEIGHAILSPMFIITRRQGGLFTFLGFLYILWFTLPLHDIPFWFLIAYGAIVVGRLAFQGYYWLKSGFIDEVMADLFGLLFLSPEEAAEIDEKAGRALRGFVHNQKILRFHTQKREKLLRQNLAYRKADDIDAMMEQTAAAILPRYNALRYTTWLAVYISLAFFVPENAINSIAFIAWPTLILGLIFILYFFNNKRYNSNLQSILHKITTTAPSVT